MEYTTTQTKIRNKRGKLLSLHQPLVPTSLRPINGWGVKVRIRGIVREIQEGTAIQTFNAVRQAYAENDIHPKAVDIWLNLNYQWLSGIPEKHRPVHLSVLLDGASEGESEQESIVPGIRHHHPGEWGALGWGMLQMYLAQDVYEFTKFKSLVVELHAWLDPALNPSIGCPECYRHFSSAVDSLHQNPLFTQAPARKWLVDFHNSVNTRIGKPVLSYEKAAKLNYWTR